MSPMPNRPGAGGPRGNIKKGICTNENYYNEDSGETGKCPKCESGEIQQVEVRRLSDFKCSKCGGKLTPIKEAWYKTKPFFIIGGVLGAGVITLAILGACGVFNGDKEMLYPEGEGEMEQVQEPVTDTIINNNGINETEITVTEPESERAAEVKEKSTNKKESVSDANYGTVNLGYGTYKGELKNGKPNGHGTVTYNTERKIVPSKDFIAHPGDKVEADWRDGVISGGFIDWYHDGDLTSFKY